MTITAQSMGGSHNYTPFAQEQEEETPKPAPTKLERPEVEYPPELKELDSGYTFVEYQFDASQTAVYPDKGTGSLQALSYLMLKLSGEAGEVGEKFAKILRDKGGKGDLDDRAEALKELGDVLWYVSQIANELNAGLDEVADTNIKKLASRKARGVLGGSGDNR